MQFYISWTVSLYKIIQVCCPPPYLWKLFWWSPMCETPPPNGEIDMNLFSGSVVVPGRVGWVPFFAQYLVEDVSSGPVSLHLAQLKQVSTHTGRDVRVVWNISAWWATQHEGFPADTESTPSAPMAPPPPHLYPSLLPVRDGRGEHVKFHSEWVDMIVCQS